MRRGLAAAFAVLLAWAALVSQGRAQAREERTQFVLLSFDTTPGPRQPIDDTDLGAYLRAVNHRRPADRPRAGYTLFIITGGLQFDPAARRLRPEELLFRGVLPRNRPVVHYGTSLTRMRRKAENIRAFSEAGVEMGSHAVRHDRGGEWDLERWRHEIADNQRIVDLHGLPRPVGFRAPFLGWNEHLFTALREHGYRYDVSQVGGNTWPRRHPRTGLWNFQIPSVSMPDRPGPVLFFDDNVRTLLARDAHARGLSGAAAERWMDDAYFRMGLEGFHRRYRGNRAPFVVGGHGSFRAATIRLMRNLCSRPRVHCGTFSEAVDYLEAHPELEGLGAEHGQLASSWRRGSRRL